MQANYLVKMENIWKSFGAIHALNGINFDVMPGEVIGLVGDNAAGKSTLMKVLTGVHQPDEGQIFINGTPVHLHEPGESRKLKIEMIYQDFALAENLDVRANIFLGREAKKKYLGGLVKILDNKKMEEESKRVLNSLDLDFDCHLKVRRLSGGQRQAVAIGRAIAFDAKLIIMDEPTANLAVGKVGKLLSLIKKLKELNIAVIIISHRMDEIFEVGDRIAVMREGQNLGTFRVHETTPAQVMSLIVGGKANA